MNPKGFLAKPGPKAPVRMTRGQKDDVLKAVAHALGHAMDKEDAVAGILGGPSMDVVKHAIDDYPTDRSCFTCDYEMGGCCLNNDRAEIPMPFREKGCDDWKDEGAPF